MKQRINIPGLLTMLALIGALAGMAMNSSRSMAGTAGMYADDDTIVRKRFLPGEIRDTAAFFEEMRARQRKDFAANINVLVRTYGDSVVLRWAADDYVAWRYLNRVGVNISRVDEETRMTETLVTGLKPATLEEFRSHYAESDSLAALVMGALYDENMAKNDVTKDEPGSMGALYESSQSQQLRYGLGLLASEWRQDLATRMAVRFTDRTAKRGRSYTYYISPAVIDTTGKVIIRAGMKDSVKNERFKPEPFDVTLTDSISYPNGIHLSWTDRLYSSYEIERRVQGTREWKRLNKLPYVIMNIVPGADCIYGDNVDEPGTYEYRVIAHDPFGELTEPSPVHAVTISDMRPPVPPRLTWIEIDRRNADDPSKEIFATIHFRKDTMEADYVGAVPVYYHERITEGKWRPLVDKPLAPTDTVVTVDVTNLQTGQLAIAAYDTAHNVSYSIPQILRVSDMKAPEAPKGLKAECRLEPKDSLDLPLGLITLTWQPVENDDIDYYEVVFANDTTHTFMARKGGIVAGRDTVFVDTVAVDVNQKYIYYKVRAIDYSTNIGEFSDVLQVVRPSAVPPTVAHIDSTNVSGSGIFMRWIAGSDAQMAYHNVYRRLMSDKEWTVLRRCDADSVKAHNNYIDLFDVPKVNSREEYVYAIESFNYSGISSGLSLQYITRFTGDAVFDTPITLYGGYEEDKHMTRLAWEVNQLPEGKDWYFCVWRQGPDDERFQFLLSAEPGERDFTDYLLRPGQTAHYYVQIQMEDGRESRPSNIVTIKAPAKR
ncbi:MAG: hypothetical protein IJ546_02580 [Prevotella sp.]|nr:hypothetical protein [Prevotella sp.]